MTSKNTPQRALVFAIIANLLWSSSYTFQEIASEYFPLTLILFLRFSIASLSTFCFLILIGLSIKLEKSSLLKVFALSFLVYLLAPLFQIFSIQNIGAIHAGLFIAVEPLFAILISLVVLKESWSKSHSLSLAIILTGLLAPVLWEGSAFLDLKLPFLLMLLAALFLEGLQGPILKPLMNKGEHPLLLGAYAYLGASLLSIPSMVLAGNDINSMVTSLNSASTIELFSLFYLGFFCTTIAYGLWYLAFESMEVSHASMVIYIQPISSTLIASLILSRTPNLTEWISLLILGLGLALFFSLEKRTLNP